MGQVLSGELSCKRTGLVFLLELVPTGKRNENGFPRKSISKANTCSYLLNQPGRVAQSVGHLTCKSGVLGSIPGLATYFRFSFRFFKKGSCQLLAKVCARSTG